MREYDLMRSIGELDDKLLNRYDPETAAAARRAARRKRLLIDLVLLLLLAGAVLWIVFRQSTADATQAPATHSEAAASLPPQETQSASSLDALLAQPRETPVRAVDEGPLAQIAYAPERIPAIFCSADRGKNPYYPDVSFSVCDVLADAALQQACRAVTGGAPVRDEDTARALAWTIAAHLPDCPELSDPVNKETKVDWVPLAACCYGSRVWEIECYPRSESELIRRSFYEKKEDEKIDLFYDGPAATVDISADDGHVIAIMNNWWQFVSPTIRDESLDGRPVLESSSRTLSDLLADEREALPAPSDGPHLVELNYMSNTMPSGFTNLIRRLLPSEKNAVCVLDAADDAVLQRICRNVSGSSALVGEEELSRMALAIAPRLSAYPRFAEIAQEARWICRNATLWNSQVWELCYGPETDEYDPISVRNTFDLEPFCRVYVYLSAADGHAILLRDDWGQSPVPSLPFAAPPRPFPEIGTEPWGICWFDGSLELFLQAYYPLDYQPWVTASQRLVRLKGESDYLKKSRIQEAAAIAATGKSLSDLTDAKAYASALIPILQTCNCLRADGKPDQLTLLDDTVLVAEYNGCTKGGVLQVFFSALDGHILGIYGPTASMNHTQSGMNMAQFMTD